jgi:hypothetical protein
MRFYLNIMMHAVFSCFFSSIYLLFCRFLRINLPAGGHPTAVAFSDDTSSIVVAFDTLNGSSLYMYGDEKPNVPNETKQQPKLPLPEIKWENRKVHEKKSILTLVGTTASYGSADGSTILASCSEGIFIPFILEVVCFWLLLMICCFPGTDIILWHGRTGKILGHVDTNQLKNTMAAISPNGRFIAAAAFTADVKVSLISSLVIRTICDQYSIFINSPIEYEM